MNTSRLLTTPALAALAGAATLGSASAQQQVCFTDAMPTTTTNWIDTLSVSRFDPNLGTLLSIDVTLNGNASGNANFESLDALATTVTTNFAVTLSLSRPMGGTQILNVVPATNFIDMVTAFDGMIDFGGTSGVSHAVAGVMDTNMVTLTAPADLALFTGPAGAPGNIVLDINAMGSSIAQGAGNLVVNFATVAGCDVQVCYNFALGSDKCNGDGGDQLGCTNCPCANNAPAGTIGGCRNSLMTSARLIVNGTPSVSNDTLQFTMTGATGSALAVLFSGSSGLPVNPLSPCFGTQSGVTSTVLDGLRCLGGTIRRHPARTTAANGTVGQTTAPWGPPGGPPQGLIARGGWTAGQTTCWQAYYRDLGGPCTTGANSTQAIAVTVVP